MQIEIAATDSIMPYPGNPRKNDSAIKAVAASIQQFGFRQPIVVDKNRVIIAGHTRWKAAQKLGLASVPVHIAANLTDEQAKAYRIADNASNDLSKWDDALLQVELDQLPGVDWSTYGLGLSLNEIANSIQCDRDMHVYKVLIDVETEEDQLQAIKMLENKGYKCRPMIF